MDIHTASDLTLPIGDHYVRSFQACKDEIAADRHNTRVVFYLHDTGRVLLAKLFQPGIEIGHEFSPDTSHRE